MKHNHSGKKGQVLGCIALGIFLLAPLSMLIGFSTALQVLVYLAMGVATVFLIVLWHKKLRAPAKLLYGGFVILPLLSLFLESARIACIIGMVYCLLAWIHLTVAMKLYGFEKKKYVLENAIIPTALVCEYIFIHWMHVIGVMDFQSGTPFPISLIIASLCAMIFLTWFAIRKKRIKPALIAFFTAFGCAFLISVLMVPVINYAFDFSQGEMQSYEIVDKYSKMQAGRRSGGLRYYLVIDQNGKEERISVTAERYLQSDVGDSFDVILYDGVLGISYIEYQ